MEQCPYCKRKMNRAAFRRHATKCLYNPAVAAKVKHVLQSCSPDGNICTRSFYDTHKPKKLPYSHSLTAWLGGWGNVAKWADLTYVRVNGRYSRFDRPTSIESAPPLDHPMQGIPKTKSYFDYTRHAWITGEVIVLR